MTGQTNDGVLQSGIECGVNAALLEQKATNFVIDLESNPSCLMNIDLNAIGNCVVYDETGGRHTMSELWSEFKTIFVFVRSFLCFTSKEYVEDLAQIPREMLKDKQIRLVVVGCAHWKHITAFRRLTHYRYFMVCDVDYDIYNQLGMVVSKDYGKTVANNNVKSSLYVGLMRSAMRAMRSGTIFDYQGRLEQQGGSMIVGPGPVLHYLHRDMNARDATPINVLLDKVGIKPIQFKGSDGTETV